MNYRSYRNYLVSVTGKHERVGILRMNLYAGFPDEREAFVETSELKRRLLKLLRGKKQLPSLNSVHAYCVRVELGPITGPYLHLVLILQAHGCDIQNIGDIQYLGEQLGAAWLALPDNEKGGYSCPKLSQDKGGKVNLRSCGMGIWQHTDPQLPTICEAIAFYLTQQERWTGSLMVLRKRVPRDCTVHADEEKPLNSPRLLEKAGRALLNGKRSNAQARKRRYQTKSTS